MAKNRQVGLVLKPDRCPFCGNTSILVTFTPYGMFMKASDKLMCDRDDSYQMICAWPKGCHAMGPKAKTQEQAIIAWNSALREQGGTRASRSRPRW